MPLLHSPLAKRFWLDDGAAVGHRHVGCPVDSGELGWVGHGGVALESVGGYGLGAHFPRQPLQWSSYVQGGRVGMRPSLLGTAPNHTTVTGARL